MSCGGPSWKREVVPDHKFDFVDTREFADNGFAMRMKYLFLYGVVLKSFLVYVSDIFSGITMISSGSWSTQILANCTSTDNSSTVNGTTIASNAPKCIEVSFTVTKWLFIGCIIFSFLLLAYESRKAKKIIASRDISYAFTNVMANQYYSLRSYNHFCFFDHISNSTKTSDDFAFFVFFTFKSWKRLLLADGPRQVINGLTLYAIYLSKTNSSYGVFDPKRYLMDNKSLTVTALIVTTSLTVTIFAISFLILVAAGICYVPLLCYIRGNLKEYCCHKVDKRIDHIIKRRQKQRLQEAAKLAKKEAMGDFTHLKNKKGELIAQPLPQPTLPNLSVDDDDDVSVYTRGPAPTYPASNYTQGNDYYYNSEKADYPPMPAYQQPYSQHQDPHGYAHFNPSLPQLDDAYAQDPYYQRQYEDDAASEAGLALGAAPYGHQYDPISRPGTAQPSPYSSQASPYSAQQSPYTYDPHDVYQGRVQSPASHTRPQRTPSPMNSAQHPPNGYGGGDYQQQGYGHQQQQHGGYGGGY